MGEIKGMATFRARGRLVAVDVEVYDACFGVGASDCEPFVEWVFQVVDGRTVPKSTRRNYPMAVVWVNEEQYVEKWAITDHGAWAIAGGLLQFYPGLFEVRVNRSAGHDGFKIYRTDYGQTRVCGIWQTDLTTASSEFGLGELPPDLQVTERMHPVWLEYVHTGPHDNY
ncbi:MAG: hypothetical protein ACYC90_00380 [Candidatus Nanopelagicales bacterium]